MVNEFTMMELFYYFGLLYHMKLSYTRRRVMILKAFLGLPTLTRKCGVLRYAFLVSVFYLCNKFLVGQLDQF